MRHWYPLIVGSALAAPVAAADLAVNITIPRLEVAEYHRPYVAFWLEKPDQTFSGNLAVWYDTKLKDKEGTKWLKDMRQWWRRSGRELAMPVDGLSSPTRAPGQHALTFAGNAAPLAQLAPGDYVVVVEAAREVGGRELVRIPISWPPKAAQGAKAQGEHELGAVTVSLAP